MWKSIKYLYYKLYKLFVKINGKEDLPEYTAMLGVGTLVFINLLSIISIINVIYQPITLFPEISRTKFFILVGIPYILVLYFIFIFNGKYNSIIKEFMNEKESKRKAGKRNVIFYMAFSLLLVVFSLTLMIMRNEGVI